MRSLLPFLLLAATFSLAGCSTTPASPAGDALDFVVVRHAEKVADGTRDPALTDAGQARAAALAALLRSRDLAAAYATDFYRTRDTAAPAAAAHGIAVTTYDAAQPAGDFVARLRRDHATGTVLVVGHSNTVPGIVSALCACPVAPIDESDYGNLFEVHFEGDEAPALSHGRF